MPTNYQGLLGPLAVAGAPVNGTDEVQTITPDAAPAAGTFRLAFEGYRTAPLAFNASANDVRDALRALPSIGANGVTVTLGGGPPQLYTVTFGGGNMAKLAHPLITVEDNTLEDAAGDPVALVVAESQAGVTATCRGAAQGAVLIDTTNRNIYVNNGTALAPNWQPLMEALGPYKVARGQQTTVAASDTVVTGLATVVAVVASLDDDPVAGCQAVTASIGDQAGAPAAGSVLIKTWKATAAGDTALIAATTFGKKVNWIAVGT